MPARIQDEGHTGLFGGRREVVNTDALISNRVGGLWGHASSAAAGMLLVTVSEGKARPNGFHSNSSGQTHARSRERQFGTRRRQLACRGTVAGDRGTL